MGPFQISVPPFARKVYTPAKCPPRRRPPQRQLPRLVERTRRRRRLPPSSPSAVPPPKSPRLFRRPELSTPRRSLLLPLWVRRLPPLTPSALVSTSGSLR